MPAKIIEIAEAVKDELNAGSFSQSFTAERLYEPQFELPEMKTLRVSVVPKGVTLAPATRSSDFVDYAIDVAVQKKIADDSETDELMTLVQEIVDFFSRRVLSGATGASWVKTENNPVWDPTHMRELRQFTSLITVTYRMLRTPS